MSLPTQLPQPKLPDPFAVPSLRWGVIGPGSIASVFVSSVHRHTGQRVVAVASRDHARARHFAELHGIPNALGSYDDLLARSDIDAVYVATRQHVHRDPVLAAIRAGKHVLVEKPIASLPADARAIFEAAQSANVLVMEALWTAYLPQLDIIRQLLADGVLGDIRSVQADLGQDQSAAERMWEPEGGGASHDMGVYPLAFIRSVLRQDPDSVRAFGVLSDRGVDVELTLGLGYADGETALASCSMLSNTRTAAWIDGQLGSLEVVAPFPVPTTLNLREPAFNPSVVATWTDQSDIQGHEGLCYQATAFASFVERGLTDSPIRSLEDGVRDVELISLARHQIGAFYPGE
ncbi:MAG: Gfo/Idh/MocA family protein [Agromyces sp.]